MVDNLNIEHVYQQIIEMFAEYNSQFYLIYQPRAIENRLTASISEKKLTLFEYRNYNIKFTPGLIALDLKQPQDQTILKMTIEYSYLEIDPKAVLMAEPRFVFGWIFSPFMQQQLAKELGYISIQSSDDGNQLLRYFDPAILSPLSNILIEGQKQLLVNPVNAWLYINSDGVLITEKNLRSPVKNLSYNLGIIDEQWQKLDFIESRNQTIARYHFFYPDYSLKEAQADIIIMQSFQDAIQRGYSDKHDLSEYAYYSLVIHPDFIQHPIIQNAIKNNKTSSLIRQLKNIDAAQWQIVKNDLTAHLKGNKS